MNKHLIIFMIFFPIACLAQIEKLSIQVVDVTDSINTSGVYAVVKVGNNPEKQMPIFGEYNQGFYTIKNLQDLNDTLHISQADYQFDILPMNHHDFSIGDNVVKLKVPAKPFYNFYQSRQFPIATSYQTKNDSVSLKIFCAGFQNPKITLTMDNSEEKYNFEASSLRQGFYEQTIAYDNLKNGTFQVAHQNGTQSFSFEAKQWYQTQYLLPTLSQAPTEREQRLIKNYFEHIGKAQTELKESQKKFEAEKDSLVSLIYKMRGQPQAPEPYPEPEPEFVSLVVSEDAQPKYGFEAFFREMEQALPVSSKYGGNTTLELEVLKGGYVSYKILHIMQEAEDIVFALKKYLRQERWKPARHRGRVFRQKIILSLDFTPNVRIISQIEKFVPEAEMIKIDKTTKTLKLKVGQKAYYQTHVHGSVGSWANVLTENSQVLEVIDGHFAYHKAPIKGETGGDRATKTFIFEAQKTGKTKLEIKHTFRGEVTRRQILKVIVK